MGGWHYSNRRAGLMGGDRGIPFRLRGNIWRGNDVAGLGSMTQVYEVPLTPQPQTLSVVFPNGNTYRMRLIFQFTPNPCWLLDIADYAGNLLICGIPLVTGSDLLAGYAYLGMAAKLFVTTDGDLAAVPTWYNLGLTSHLWLEG